MNKPVLTILALLMTLVVAIGDVGTLGAAATVDTLRQGSTIGVSSSRDSATSLINTADWVMSSLDPSEAAYAVPSAVTPPPRRFMDEETYVKDSLLFYARKIAKCCTFTPEKDGLRRVGEDRQVAMCIKHHIYVDGDSSKPYDPAGYTQPPFKWLRPWKNSDLVHFRKQQIKAAEAEAKRILQQNGMNISLTAPAAWMIIPGGDLGRTEVVVDSNMKRAELDGWGAYGYTSEVIVAMRRRAPHCINVHWVWGSTSAAIGTGSFYEVVIATEKDKEPGKLLAHELVHALGYEKHLDLPDNLMADAGVGTKLTREQVQAVWDSLNTRISDPTWGTNILVLSCPKTAPSSCQAK